MNPLCKTFNDQNGRCTSCYPGYRLDVNRGSCAIFFKDPNCKIYDANNQCQQCANKYFVNVESGKCSPVNPLCRTFNPDNGFCTTCYQGYGLLNGQCLINVASDPNCKRTSGAVCVECYPRLYINNGKCLPVSDNCKTYDSLSGLCTSCYEGYAIEKGQCD